MCFDARRHPQAQRIYHTGMRLAREAATSLTTRHATANLVASAAYQAAWLGHHNDAAALLDIAASTPELPSAVAAVIADRRIYAAGRRHDPEAILRFRDEALGPRLCRRAHTVVDNLAHQGLRGRHHLPGLSRLRPAEAGRPPSAQPRRDDRPHYPRDHLHAVLDLADTVHQRGDGDQARELLDRAERLISTVSSQRMMHRLDSLSSAVAAT
ncbi:hypothetical protein ACH4MM_05285 [Streptomyces pratensis]|uniref:hypothetical protein n=1 Tax=Streptomyces pratensis TaxID=1169025 RepID=UPI0037AE6CF9